MKLRKRISIMILAAMLSTAVAGVSVNAEGVYDISEQSVEAASAQSTTFTVQNSVLQAYTGKASKVVIPSNLGIKKIGAHAFAYNTTIKEVVIPKGVTEIGAKAFLGCDNLEKISIPSTVKVIGYHAISGPWMEAQMAKGNAVVVNSILIAVAHVKQDTLTIPYGVTNVSDFVFEGNRGCYKNLVIPATMKSLQFCSIQGGFKTIKILSKNVVLDKNCGAFDCTIYGYKGSTAEAYVKKYGKEKNIVFKALPEQAVHTHSWTAWKTTKKATVFKGKLQTRTCKTCKKAQTKYVGKPLKSTIKVSASNIKIKRNLSSKALRVSGMANGDYVAAVKSGNTSIVQVTKFDKKGNIVLKAKGKKGKVKLNIRLAGGAQKTVVVAVV